MKKVSKKRVAKTDRKMAKSQQFNGQIPPIASMAPEQAMQAVDAEHAPKAYVSLLTYGAAKDLLEHQQHTASVLRILSMVRRYLSSPDQWTTRTWADGKKSSLVGAIICAIDPSLRGYGTDPTANLSISFASQPPEAKMLYSQVLDELGTA